MNKLYGTTSDGVHAVDGVTFDVAPGELFVIMGLSGSGKSTLLRMLNRLVEPSSGTLRIDGRDVLGMGDADLRELRNHKINMVFQHFALFPHRTVRQNAAYGMRVRGVTEAERLERADWALKTVGLGDRGDAYPDQLSGGQRQRVGLARALATDAEILLMDEPFSALDPLIRRDMQDLLLTLQRDLRRTIIFVTHDLNEAMRLGDRIMVMRDGRVVQLGTATDILHTPADDYVRDFVSDVDRSRVLTASAIMREPLMTANADDDPRDVLRRLSNAEASGVYVRDADGRIVGVARDDLLAQAVRENRASLRECLVDEYEQTGPDTLLVDLCPRVGRHAVPLAVTDDDGHLLGVVPRAALLTALSDPRTTDSSDPRKEAAHV
ncbi:betaine/proline/choline family ABC transporter ATP-binding protein [Streptomyces scabiei]|nr:MULTISPECIES: betaine/proline/choline family ABC transporter ATP-binding protein [Streptomyces]MDW8471551.1 betaine/proline/choline family ABC transporter ATP-binding protein [Streptomyces scabiei]MDX2567951.1 betaine/proline/choline family ABC transporter ATP-binding protein [Streptomyces scabiei]MDX3148310.1 betaine/proline/choline family ABC transporter ATP-binding protein [Streptomyces scabiei]MDX3156854.1 betaine/proline/choline family ABC transporter ATP-binding protein [Streptomyces s